VIDANGTALLSDFALSTLVDEHGSLLFGQSELELGTVRWTAPESLTGENGNATRNAPTKRSDIYAFGGIMLQVRDGLFNLVSPALKHIGGIE
jgi:serine/threonine protein kinase